MSGGSINHSRITGNVVRELGNQLKGTPREVFDPGLRVVCGPVGAEAGQDQSVLDPRLVIEVLSPSTEVYARVTFPPPAGQ